MAEIVPTIRFTLHTPAFGVIGPPALNPTLNSTLMNPDRGELRRYLDSIGRIPLMTPSEEIEMGRLVKRARELRSLERPLTPAEQREIRRGDRARQRFVEANMRLVVYIAKKMIHKIRSLEMADLLQEGSIGLMRAAELYDHERGYKFSTYAYWWIKQAVHRLVGTTDRLIRRPSTVGELANKLPGVVHTLTLELGRTPTKEEIADAAKTSVRELETLSERSLPMLSLEYGNDEGGSLLAEFVADPLSADIDEIDLALDDAMAWDQVSQHLKFLDPKDLLCVKMRYGIDCPRVHTLQEIGDHKAVCLSKEMVRQRIARALRRIKVSLRHLQDPAETRADATSGAATKATAYSGHSLAAVAHRSKAPAAQAQKSAWPLSA